MLVMIIVRRLSRWCVFALGASLTLVGVFMTGQMAKAAVNAPTGATAATTTTSTVSVTWVSGGGDEMFYSLQQSTGDCSGSFSQIATTTTSTLTYTFASLSVNTQYCFRVAASDGVTTSTFSTTSAKYTLLNEFSLPASIGSPVGTSTMTVLAPHDVAGDGFIPYDGNPTSSQYAFYNITDGRYLDANGAATTTPIWQPFRSWNSDGYGSIRAIGLALNTPYEFVYIARNGDNVQVATSSPNSPPQHTAVNPAGTSTVVAVSDSSLSITVDTNSNPASTTYAIYNSSLGVFLDASGAPTTTAVYQTTSTWGASVTSTGLSANTSYQFSVVARDAAFNNAATSSLSTAKYTLATTPASVVVTPNSTTQLTVTWVGNGTTYNVFNSTANSNTVVATSSYAQTGLTCGTRYFYTITAYNSDGVVTSGAAGNGTTNSCSGGGSPALGGGGGSPAPTPTPTPVVTTTPAANTTTSVVAPVVPSSTTSANVNTVVNNTVTTPNTPAAILLAPLNPNSKLIISAGPELTGVGGNQKLTFSYSYKNSSATVQTYSLVRELTDAKGKVVARTTGKRTVQPGKSFVVKVTEVFGKKTAAGLYLEKVKVFDASGKTLVDQNSVAFVLAAPVKAAYQFTKYLSMGAKGVEVAELQKKLAMLGYYSGPVNSTYDAATKAAVVALQVDNNLKPAAGYVGPGTRAVLNR